MTILILVSQCAASESSNLFTPNQKFYMTIIGLEAILVHHELTTYDLSNDFKFNSEGWFGKHDTAQGIDKVGHAHGGYITTRLLSELYQYYGFNKKQALNRALISSIIITTTAEISDGYNIHGFSWEDFTANNLGLLFAYYLETHPTASSLIDFRALPYYSIKDFVDDRRNAIKGDRSIQEIRYFLSLNFSGIEKIKHTMLQYFGFDIGYHAVNNKRNLFVGLNINFYHLLNSFHVVNSNSLGRGVANVARHIQPPSTAVGISSWKD